ncbi:hypothetical protein Syun_017138 [Stephania yunnanensis]|uniref:Uncharacterized protein n=1 Tax=Stephania yunnanensis TaxID=152371 RepID=A0AAP0J8M7_9MAGN
MVMALAGNKEDLEDKRKVTTDVRLFNLSLNLLKFVLARKMLSSYFLLSHNSVLMVGKIELIFSGGYHEFLN